MKQRILIACVAVLTVAAIVFGALFFTNDADKTKTIDALKGEKATLTDDVAGKAEQIAGLEGEKEQLIADHEAALKGKDDEITKLTGEKEQLIADHAAAIEGKDGEIATLTGEKEQLIADHAAAIEGKDGEIATLTGEKEQLIADHAAAIEGKDGEIATLTGEKNQLIADHAAAIEGKDGEIATLTGEKNQLIADHEKAIHEKQAEIDKLIGEKEQLTADHEQAIKEKEDEINKLTGEKEQLIADHEQAIKDKDDKIQKLENEYAMALAAKDVTIEELENRVESLQSFVSEMTVLTEDNTVEAVVEEAPNEEIGPEEFGGFEDSIADEAVAEEVAAGMTYAEYVAAPWDAYVEVETYVQAKQSWWDNKGTFYTQNADGAYFIYEMAISEEDYNKLVPGTRILVKGYKTEWAGEVEIVDATFEILEGSWIAPAKDLTAVLGTDELINYQNQLAAFRGMTVKAIEYKNGEPGDDIYVTLSKNGISYEFCVERYLTGPETEVYQAFAALHTGDIVDVEGFVYWYNGVNPHIIKVTVVARIIQESPSQVE